ncbi:MAG: KilA-N domain-containing protein [Bacilli bacterium]
MENNLIQTELNVNNNKIRVIRINEIDYISLTDLAKYSNSENPANVIIHWMSNIGTFDYIGLWEQLNNENFNFTGFSEIKNKEVGYASFTLSPKRWIDRTNAIGIYSKGGKYSIGTFAHPDIAFEFASWLSPEFKLYLIKEFERLKKNEYYQYKVEWNANRILSKVNYVVHTDAIKNFIVPTLTEEQKRFVYAEEADVLNVALFGMTAKEWRENDPELAKNGNMRDYTDLLHLVILSNLETINASLISDNVSQRERLIKLNNNARMQIETLKNNKNIKDLELLQQINNDKLLIENK